MKKRTCAGICNRKLHEAGNCQKRKYAEYNGKERIFFSAIFFIIPCLLIILMNASFSYAETAYSGRIREAMKVLREEALKYGEPRISGIGLYFGSTKINGNYDLVDSMMDRFGCTATFFVKKGDGFMRVSTNVLDRGVRAIGTMLDPKGKAIASMRNNEAFYGIVDILGKQYDTGYEPVKNAGGETIGIYYIGYCIEK